MILLPIGGMDFSEAAVREVAGLPCPAGSERRQRRVGEPRAWLGGKGEAIRRRRGGGFPG